MPSPRLRRVDTPLKGVITPARPLLLRFLGKGSAGCVCYYLQTRLRMDLGLIYMVLRRHGSAWCLRINLNLKRSMMGVLEDRPFSAAASVYISREAWETQNHQTFSSISLLGTLGPRDRRLCTRIVLVHDRPFSVTSEESLRDSEPPDIFLLGTRAPRDRRSECIKLVLVSFTLISHIVC